MLVCQVLVMLYKSRRLLVDEVWRVTGSMDVTPVGSPVKRKSSVAFAFHENSGGLVVID